MKLGKIFLFAIFLFYFTVFHDLAHFRLKPDVHDDFGVGSPITAGAAILNHHDDDLDVVPPGAGLHGSETSYGFFNPHGDHPNGVAIPKQHRGEAIDYYGTHPGLHGGGANQIGSDFSMETLPEYQYEKAEFDHHIPIHSYRGDGHQINNAPFFQEFIHHPNEPIHHATSLHGPHIEPPHLAAPLSAAHTDHVGVSLHGSDFPVPSPLLHHAPIVGGFHPNMGTHFNDLHDPHSIHMQGPPHLHQPPPAAALLGPLPPLHSQVVPDKIHEIVNIAVDSAIQNKLPNPQPSPSPSPPAQTEAPVTPPSPAVNPAPAPVTPPAEVKPERTPAFPSPTPTAPSPSVVPPIVADPLTQTNCLEEDPCQEETPVTAGAAAAGEAPVPVESAAAPKNGEVEPGIKVAEPDSTAATVTPGGAEAGPAPAATEGSLPVAPVGGAEPGVAVTDPGVETTESVTPAGEAATASAEEPATPPNSAAATVVAGGEVPATASLAEAGTDVTDKINGGLEVTDTVKGAASPTLTVGEAATEVANKPDSNAAVGKCCVKRIIFF